jgi:hypothetical protein
MTLTRRDLLTGVPAVVIGAGAVATAVEGGGSTPTSPTPQAGQPLPVCPECGSARPPIHYAKCSKYVGHQPLPASLAPIPTDAELRHWETHYKARYKAAHLARNRAILDMANGEEAIAKRADLVLEDLHAEQDAALGLVDEREVSAVAGARNVGFAARRLGYAATLNPYTWQEGYNVLHSDTFMAWYAGWVQAGDQSHVLDGSRGYTPPQPYFCSLCGVAEGQQHNGGCADQNPVHPDGLIVRRPRPWRHGGHTFT